MWLAVDIGAKRTGVATSSSGLLATPWGIVEGQATEQVRQLIPVIESLAITTIVIGVPRLGQGSTSLPPQIEVFTKELRSALAERAVTLVFVDETLSTKEVERRLGRQPRRDDKTDAAAAQLILEDYLHEQNQKSEARNSKQ
ncbi:MAG: Holliday junction resolvase RuvX [Patescibacteria group bacterium]